MAADFVFKIIIVGEAGVGKSCLLRRFVDQNFTENYVNTIGVDFKVRTVEMMGKTIKLNIWDSAGQERFRTIVNTYYRGARGICLVYDITDPDSFIRLGNWLTDAGEQADERAKKMIIGTKTDLESHRKVSREDVQVFADRMNLTVVETSSKNGSNVEAAFLSLTRQLLEDVTDGELENNGGNNIQLSGNTQSLDQQKETKKKKCC
ncbi:uncharacterized protein [Clytia hemisphaerica]|uniref:Uncharacterized protein n=1 Tax=Clytia hemisphaerica TaxID=252671 RepID=A0A7M5UVI8_9CNID